MTRVFVALGSNMGDREHFLRDAVYGLPGVVAVSSLYETDPVGGVVQDDFLNAVVELDVDMVPQGLLAIGQKLEAEAQRKRVIKNGPRTLDVDILIFGNLSVDEDNLTVPHPRMKQRRFVLAPLNELAPELVDPSDIENAEGDVRVYKSPVDWLASTWTHGSTHALWTTKAFGGLGHNPVGQAHSDRCCGEAIEDRRSRLRSQPWLPLSQVHGDSVVVAGDVNADFPSADASVTISPDVTLAISTADCAPIALSCDEGIAGGVHAGWKGLEAGIIESTVREMRNLGATKIVGALGPCIGAECYEFGQVELDRFAEKWGSQVVGSTKSGQPSFDLRAAVASVCKTAGIDLQFVDPRCTACSGEFFSYRDKSDTDRQVMLVWVDPKVTTT